MIRAFSALCLAGALAATSAALAQDNPSVLDRLFGRPERAGPDTTGQTGQVPTTEQVLRIERLEAQIRQLTGQLEQLQYRNQQLEAALRRYEGVAAPAGAPAAPPPVTRPSGQSAVQTGPVIAAPAPAPAPAPPPSGRRSDVFDPAQHPNAPGTPRTLGTIPGIVPGEPPLARPQASIPNVPAGPAEPPPVIAADSPVGAPGGRSAGAPLDLSTLATGAPPQVADPAAPTVSAALPPPPSRNLSATGATSSVAPPSESAKDYYDLGYGYVLRKDYALAEQTFDAFLKKFPSDRRAADAQFWLGESLFQRQRYDQAAAAFLDLSTKHGSHGKAPDALLRLGQSLAALKQKEMACATLAEVGRKYPRASNSVKQGVEREQKRVRC
jgi:tol-pal system protein YbgF